MSAAGSWTELPAPKELSALHHHNFFHWSLPGSGRFVELRPRRLYGVELDFWDSDTSCGCLNQSRNLICATVRRRSECPHGGRVARPYDLAAFAAAFERATR